MEEALDFSGRDGEQELEKELAVVSNNTVVAAMISSVGGLLAVLNEKRQVLALNHAFIEQLGVHDAEKVFGLRLGEVVGCIHAAEPPGGCGTTAACQTCGAAIAMLASQFSLRPESRKCIVSTCHNEKNGDIAFQVRSVPMVVGEVKCLLVFLQNITASEKWSEIERIFCHDLANSMTTLQGGIDMLVQGKGVVSQNVAQIMQSVSRRIAADLAIQKILLKDEMTAYPVNSQLVRLTEVVDEVRLAAALHSESKGKRITFSEVSSDRTLKVDFILLMRILMNMLINAMEATPVGGEVKFSVKDDSGAITFQVWNAASIPMNLHPRIFQRYFSTKAESGRGLGTYAIKLFGERYLGGTVDFRSSEEEGTIFSLRLNQ